MAKLESTLRGDFDRILQELETAALGKDGQTVLRAKSDVRMGALRCAVRVFERPGMLGQGRITLNLNLVGGTGGCYLSAITAGGGTAKLLKMGPLGEESFLSVVRGAAWKYRK